uniref:type III-A CRISPR-associated protein Csm2 n=1 Tax=Brachyspira catarrhinii TaxID=2528966 RepID=UPI003F4CA52C
MSADNKTFVNKDLTLDIEEAQYFVQKYIIVNFNNKLNVFASTNQIRKFLSAVNRINNGLLVEDDMAEDKKINENVIRDIKYMKTQLAYLVGRSRDNKDNNEDVYSKEIDSKLNEYLSKDMLNKLSYKKTFNNKEHSFCKKGIEALYIRILPKIDLIISERKLEDFKELARYIEAIVSYHKFYGGN